MNEKKRRLLKDIFIFTIGNMGSKLILFLLVPLYTNYLTTAEYGISELVFTVSQLLIPLISITVFDAVTRFGLMKSEKPENVLLCAFSVLAVGGIVTVFISELFVFYPPLKPWRWYLCAYTVLSAATSVELNYLKVLDRNKQFALVSIIQTLVLALMNIWLLAIANIGVRGYLLSNISACAVAFVLCFLLGNVGTALKNATFDRKLLGRMTAFSTPLILNNISWWVIHSSDKIMIERMMDASALGIYTIAAKIPALVNVLISIFTQAWGLASIREEESSQNTSFYSEILTVYSFLVVFAVLLINSVIKPFMQIYVGADFREAWQYVPILLVSAAFSAISAFYGSVYSAIMKSKNNMFTTLAGALTNLVLNYVFIQIYGVWGAVLGTVAAYIVIMTSRIVDVQRYLHLSVSWGRFLGNLLLMCVQAIAVAFTGYGAIASGVALVALFALNADIAAQAVKTVKTKLGVK